MLGLVANASTLRLFTTNLVARFEHVVERSEKAIISIHLHHAAPDRATSQTLAFARAFAFTLRLGSATDLNNDYQKRTLKLPKTESLLPFRRE